MKYRLYLSKKGSRIAESMNYISQNDYFPFGGYLKSAIRALKKVKERGGRGHIVDNEGTIITIDINRGVK